jgi:hypothetical protein
MNFKTGHTYRNRKGKYTVLRIEDPNMIIRYQDGRLVRVPIEMQARIWERIQEEELYGAEDVDIDMRDDAGNGDHKTSPVRDLAARVLCTISQPWPPDITDQVCLAIERRPQWLAEYRGLVKELGEWSVNTSLGAHVKDLTNLENAGQIAAAKSKLIKSYSILVPSGR